MNLSEQLGPSAKPEARKDLDVRKEARDMVERHALQMKNLKDSISDPHVLEQSTMKATDDFTGRLEGYLLRHLPEEEAQFLFQELTASLKEELHPFFETESSQE